MSATTYLAEAGHVSPAGLEVAAARHAVALAADSHVLAQDLETEEEYRLRILVLWDYSCGIRIWTNKRNLLWSEFSFSNNNRLVYHTGWPPVSVILVTQL